MAGIPFLSKILALAGIGVKNQTDNKEVLLNVSPSQPSGTVVTADLPKISGQLVVESEVVLATEKGAPNGVATLDGGGKIPTSQIPPLAITHTYVVATIAEMLNLGTVHPEINVGDIAVVTGENETFILAALPTSVLANWVELLESSGVQSVNGDVGPNVVLDAVDVGALPITGGSLTGLLTIEQVGAGAGEAGRIALRELTVNGAYTVSLRSPDALSDYVTLTLPDSHGSAGQILTTDGTGVMSWQNAPVDSVTSVNGKTGVVVLNAADVGAVAKTGDTMSGALIMGPEGTLSGQTGKISFQELAANGTNSVGFKAADAIAADVTWTLPAADGSAGQVLVTSGSGVLSWSTITVPVTSVNGQTGDVVLTTTDIAEGTNLYFTDARAQSAAVVNSTAGSETVQAPSVSAVKAYVEAEKDVLFYASEASFPAVGQEDVIYVDEAEDKIFRFNQTSTPITPSVPPTPAAPSVFDHIVGPTGSFPTLEAALASPSVTDGQSIQIQASTYTVSSTININKKVKIYGAGKTQSVFVTAGAAGDPVTMLNVSVDDVILYGIGLQHKKTSNTSVESALTVSGPSFPQTRVANFIIDSCRIEHVEFGMTIRGSAWKIANTDFVYKGPNNSTRRHVGIYGTLGNCFAVGNTSNEDIAPGVTGTTRWFTPTSTTGTNPNETYEGQLVIQGNSQVGGTLAQFYSQDSWQGSAGGFKLFVNNNTTNETNAFVSLYGGASGFGNILSEITVIQNNISNNHGSGGGKGLIGVDGTGPGISFRSSALTVHQSGNVLGQLVFRTGYAEAIGSTGALVGYNTAGVAAVTVAVDSNVSTVVNEYIELSRQDVSSVNGKTGAVILTTSDIAEGSNLYFTDARAKSAAVVNSTSGSETDQAASVAAMKSYVDAVKNFTPAQTKYVSKNGSDVTGTGSEGNPYASITAALNSITDASPTNRYVILVAAGNYTEASVVLKANIFIIGSSVNATRITGAVTMAADFSGGGDNISGFSNCVINSTVNLNWTTVTSAAGKFYCQEVTFISAVTLYGYNNATAQARFTNCTFFGVFTNSGINVGIHSNNTHFADIVLNQHPNGGMASILSAQGGRAGKVTLTTTVNDFSRRCSLFAWSMYIDELKVDGVSSYADITDSSVPKDPAKLTAPNSGNIVYLNSTVPYKTNDRNIGEPGKQYLYSFSYVNASTLSDHYIVSMGGAYAADSAGRSIFIEADTFGLNPNVSGGNISLTTAVTSGTGVRGIISLDARQVEVSSALVMKPVGTLSGQTGIISLSELAANGSNTISIRAADSLASDITLTLPANAGAAGQVLTTNGSGVLSWADAVDPSLSSRVDKLEASRGIFTGSLNSGQELDISSLVPSGSIEYPIVQVYKVVSGVNQQINVEFSFDPATKKIIFGAVVDGPISAVIHVLALTSPLTTL